MSGQANLFFWNNQNLFSNNYIENRLTSSALWNAQKDKAAIVFEEIKTAYDAIKALQLGSGEEAGLEDKFIRPVLNALGFEWDVQPTTERGTRKKRPDYALFSDRAVHETARKDKFDSSRFFSQALTILEAKYWGRRLNDADPKDKLDRRDPTAQTVKYLDDVYHITSGRIQWAILTNGKLWRIFYYRAASRSGNFFEIDLEEIILRNDAEAFVYFYLFFSKDAFVPDAATGKTWLEQHLKETEEYASRVSDKLKNLIFDHIFEGLATGFIEYRRGELGITKETDESLKEIFNGCLTLLYRMLFLLYAESRGLLPVNDPDRYYKKSLKKIKEDVCDELRRSGLDGLSHNAYDYWSRLESLFRIIDKGDRALNIPIYNGGLFETMSDSFLTRHKISDPYIAEAIKQLTVDPDAGHTPGTTSFFDYSSLNVRHLGDVYEGLLEFHVRIAEEDIIEVKEKGKFLWKKAPDVKTLPGLGREKALGEVYIENSKHERKATGSYYTPHYIVEYIVANTAGPVLNERLGKAKALFSNLDSLYEKQRRQLKQPADWNHWEHPGEPKGKHADDIMTKEHEVFETLFDIKVLDPAMGSGHFLVHTVDFISDRIITFLADYPDNPVVRKIDELREAILSNIREQKVTIDDTRLTEVNLIKRMVMKRCIYGVDLNEMAVELAKLSLWLDSFTLGAPLSFLDHHLKCGNSLIGVFDISDVIIPGTEMYGQVQRALSYMLQVSELTDATVSEAKTSYDLFNKGRKTIEPLLRRFNALTAKHFIDTGWNTRIEHLAYTLDYKRELFAEVVETCKKALKIAEEKRFFHWKVEFPEVFYTDKGEKENPGFDCVIGNPPYGIMFDEAQKAYLNKGYISAQYQLESFTLCIEKGIALSKENGFQAFITPTTWLSMQYYENLRSLILSDYWLQQVILFKESVFPEATVETCIEIVQKRKPEAKAVTSLGIVSAKPEYMVATWVNLEQMKIEKFESKRISEYLTPAILDLCEGIKKRTLPLVALADLVVGCKPYQTGKGTPPQTKENVVNRLFDATYKKDNSYKQYLRGEDFHRYSLNPQEERWISYGSWLAEPRPSAPFFAAQKVVIRQTADTLITTIDDNMYLNLNNVHNLVLKEKHYSLPFILSLLNSKFLSFFYRIIVPEFGRIFAEVKIVNLEKLPIPLITFTTPEKERKARVQKAIELYESYMVELEQKGYANEKTEASAEYNRAVGAPVAGGKEGKVSGEHPGAGVRVHGVRGRTRKPDDAEGVHEESEEYSPSPRSTRYIESSLGIKSYSELAPYLAKEVERVMASLLEKSSYELKVTPEFTCELHKDAFEGLFPSWAGRYRDRNVKVGDYEPPPYYEVPVLMRRFCDDLEFRFSSPAANPPDPSVLIEAFAFAEGRLLSIHPFRDFNGRVTRMLLFALLCRFDKPPVRLVPDEKDSAETDEYLNALTEADRMNWEPLIAIWKKRLGLGEGK